MPRSLTHELAVIRLKRQDEAGALPEPVDSGGVDSGRGAEGGDGVDAGVDADGGADAEESDDGGGSDGR